MTKQTNKKLKQKERQKTKTNQRQNLRPLFVHIEEMEKAYERGETFGLVESLGHICDYFRAKTGCNITWIEDALESEFRKRIERCEKYNGETLRDFLQVNPKDAGLDIFIENAHDLIADFISLFIKAMDGVTKENPVKVEASLLKVDDNGNIFLNGKKYKILTK